MSFICNFPPYFKNNSSLDFDKFFSLNLEKEQKSQNLNSNLELTKYENDNEIKFNISEQKNVKYIKQGINFELILQISGKTILKNLILTAKANNKKGDPIPIKCQWRRVKSDKEKKIIEKINSYSYMPNAQDLGFFIEVEVENLDNKGDIAIAKYGPLIIDRDTEIIIEEMINYEKKCFSLILCDEKNKNRNFVLELGKKDIKLSCIDKKGIKINYERSKYSLANPSLELCNTNVNKFKISFIIFNNNDNNINSESNSNISNNISFYTEENSSDIYSSEIKGKNVYEFFAQSKQNRELIYLIIQYNLFNIKLRNCKIFRASNYNIISSEAKNGILKLIGDLKVQKEQNLILEKNIKYLEYVNKELNEECNTLEENIKITMEKINGRDINLDQNSNNNNSNGNYFKKNINIKNLKNSEDEWNYKLNELKKNYNSLLAKQKAINEEKILLINKEKNNLKMVEKNEEEINDIKIKNNNIEEEIKNNDKNFLILNNDKLKLKKNLEDIEKNLKLIQDKNNILKNDIKDDNNNNEKKKNRINEIKLNNENLNYEKKNLIMQKNMLNNQKNNIIKEIQKFQQEKEKILQEKKKNNKNKENVLISNLEKENENIQKEYEKIKDDYQLLILENINLKEKYDKEKKNQSQNKVNIETISNNTIYQLTPEEYEEYENLRRNRDENEAIIMQLKNNSESLDNEIKQLKNKINKIKKIKKKN